MTTKSADEGKKTKSGSTDDGNKFRVVVGKDWDLEVVEIEGPNAPAQKILQELHKLERTKMERKELAGRLNLSYTIVGAALAALILATVWGWTHDDFAGVEKVWSVASVPIGWVAGYYFRSHGNRSKST